MRHLVLLLFTLTVFCADMVLTFAQSDESSGDDRLEILEKRVQNLEEMLKQRENQAECEATEKLAGEKDANPVFSFWKNDLYLSTPNEEFWMKIRGNLHFDSKFYGGDSENPSHFDIRRARIDFQGKWYQSTSFRVQAEFADTPYIRNAWVDFELADWLHVRAGQMKPPFSSSWWTTDNNVNFLERGAGTPLYPYFDRGWWLWGDLLDQTLTWNLSAFNGTGMELDERRGDIDDHKDVIAKLFYRPLKNHDESVFQGLYLCAEASMGAQSVPTDRFETRGYGAAVRDNRFWTWETESIGHGEIDSRMRTGGEIHYIYGPFSLSSEYLTVYYDDIEVFAADGTRVIEDDGDLRSWSTWISYFLTGEQKRLGNFGWKQPKPTENFDIATLQGSGAWEVLLRYTATRTSDSLFDTVNYGSDLYRILEGADRVNEYTVGLAWTWNPMVRWQLNYVHLNGNDMARGADDHEDMLGLRMILKF